MDFSNFRFIDYINLSSVYVFLYILNCGFPTFEFFESFEFESLGLFVNCLRLRAENIIIYIIECIAKRIKQINQLPNQLSCKLHNKLRMIHKLAMKRFLSLMHTEKFKIWMYLNRIFPKKKLTNPNHSLPSLNPLMQIKLSKP